MQPHQNNFNDRMQIFLRNKDGQIRFSEKDATWLTLFAGEADSVTQQMSGLQQQTTLDRILINEKK